MTRPDHQQGSVLILTLLITIGLAAAALVFGQTTVLRYHQTTHQTHRLEADAALDGATRYVQALLTAKLAAEEVGELPERETYLAEALEIGRCRVWMLGRSTDAASDEAVFALQDEAGKLNLNTATLEMLDALPGMTAELAAAIVDWRDSDMELTANGAEAETYLGFDPPYIAKDSSFETVAELRLLNGAEPRLLSGIDRNRNSRVEGWERELAEAAKVRFADTPDIGLVDLVTVHSSEPNTKPDGSERTNLNGPPGQVRQALIDALGAERGEAVGASLGGVTYTSVLQFCLLAKLTEAEAEVILDQLTVDPGGAIVGRVNVRTASAAVLACLPGLSEDSAAWLVDYREQNPNSLQGMLWVAKAIGDEAAITLGPFITDHSYQVTADLVAVSPQARAFRRARLVIDTTTGAPIVISRRDLTHAGWPLGETLYAELRQAQGALR